MSVYLSVEPISILKLLLVVAQFFYKTRMYSNLIPFFSIPLSEYWSILGVFWQTEKKKSVLISLLLSYFCLLGGYETFYSEYPECCVDVKPISQEKVETERALISQCGKSVLNISCRPAYDQVRGVEVPSRPLALFLAQHPGSPSPWSLTLVGSFADQGAGRGL